MVNYYELLGIQKDASRMIIEQEIKKTRRLWNNRANSPDASIRAEAEKHVREIAEAEKILLNDSQREEYDRQLSLCPVNDSNDQHSSDDMDGWIDEYWDAMERDYVDIAIQIAQRAVSANSKDGEALFLYGEALRRAGNYNEAINALHRASIILPDHVGIFRQLGWAYIGVDNYAEGLRAFQTATKLNPDESEFYIIRSKMYRDLNMLDEAMNEAEQAYRMDPENEDAKDEYFTTLYLDVLRSVSYNRSSGKHLIINKVQLDYANKRLKEMALIKGDSNSPEMNEIVQLIVDAESKKGGLLKTKMGYQYNYDISNADTRSTGKH